VYDTAEELFSAGMSILDSLAVPLSFLCNRYEKAIEVVCIEVPYRYGLVMSFIRAQSKV
jgi:hypothetical protein